MFREKLVTAVRALLAFSLLCGVLYPFAITAIAQAAFPKAANASLIIRGGKPIGSSLIGQQFTDARYFWSRPSATSPSYNGASSSGSNFGPLNPALKAEVEDRMKALQAADPQNTKPIPIDLVTSSASGLDPHISIAAAQYQKGRVARARSIPETAVEALIQKYTQPRSFGVFGEPVVNVLLLDIALDESEK